MIKVKEKKCKGTGQAIGHGCGSPQLVRKYGLGIKCRCYTDWLLNTDSGKAKMDKSVISARKTVEKESRKESREYKEKNKSIAALIQDARKPFQAYIRFRDANEACISCGLAISEIWDAGHFYKAELYSGLIFDDRNVHKQCRKCNMYFDGNEGMYRESLDRKFGKVWLKKLDADAIYLKSYKYTREELIEIKKYYQNYLKHHANN